MILSWGTMEYSTWAFLLLVVGTALLIAEVFIPSGGVIVFLSIVSLVGALGCAWGAWWSTNPGYFWGFASGMALLLPMVVGGAFYVWPSTPMGRRALLEGPAPHEVASFVEEEEKYSQMVGKTGEALTMLNPAGIVRIDGHRVHCQSEGVIIDVGTWVKVVSAKSNRVIVRQTARPAPQAPAHQSSRPAQDASQPQSPASSSPGVPAAGAKPAEATPFPDKPLDFDIT
jgi:membrane-bound ClpP family serine protease